MPRESAPQENQRHSAQRQGRTDDGAVVRPSRRVAGVDECRNRDCGDPGQDEREHVSHGGGARAYKGQLRGELSPQAPESATWSAFSSRAIYRAYCCEALELATLIASLVTAAAVAGSVLFLARQTSQSVQQFLVANELAGARALAQGYELWDHVITRFIDYPELRQYFYEGVEPPEDPIAMARVLAMTELIGDALQSGDWLYQGKDVALLGAVDPASDIRTDWDDWTQFILTMSPVLRAFVRQRPLQYPFVTRMLNTIESATTG